MLRSRRLLEFLLDHGATLERFGALDTPQQTELAEQPVGFPSAEREYADGPAFAGHFRGAFELEQLAGRRVLDVGCGFGGRTVYYAGAGAAEVVGIEPTEAAVERCRAFAAEKGAANVRFVAAEAERLPFPDRSFDRVLSFDVLEHVRDPELAVRETARVLADEGSAWLVFPTYLGARSSHLDPVTRLPALHRLFDPEAIVDALNARGHAWAPPARGPLGRVTLPNLNGLTLADAHRVFAGAGLCVVVEVITPVVAPETRLRGGRAAHRLLALWQRTLGLPELLIDHIAVALAPAR